MAKHSRWRLDHVRIVWEDDDELREDGSPYSGCRAEAVVSYAIGDGCRRIETLSSGGLWRIDAPDDPHGAQYRREVEAEELADLKDHLRVFGVPVDEFDGKVRR